MACLHSQCIFARCLLFISLSLASAEQVAAQAAQPACSPSFAGSTADPSASNGNSVTADNSNPALNSSTANSLQAFIDPQTGELVSEPPGGRPTLPDAPAAASRPELTEELRPDGSAIMRMDDQFMTPLQAEVIDQKLVVCHGEEAQHEQPR